MTDIIFSGVAENTYQSNVQTQDLNDTLGFIRGLELESNPNDK